MSERSGKNEGFRMLEECACEATPDSSLQLSGALAPSPGRGVNRGIHILQEVVVTAGPPETGEALRQRKERLPRLALSAILYGRGRELGKKAPITPSDLDFNTRNSILLHSVVSRFLLTRSMYAHHPNGMRGTYLIDVAILMAELARPNHIFLAEARQTAIDVADRLLRAEGWSLDPASDSDWREKTLAIDATAIRAGKNYLDCLRRYWGWTGQRTEVDDEIVRSGLVIPDSMIADLIVDL